MIISKVFNPLTIKSDKEILNEITLWMEKTEKEIKAREGTIQAISHSITSDSAGGSSGSAIICYNEKEMKEEKVDGEKK